MMEAMTVILRRGRFTVADIAMAATLKLLKPDARQRFAAIDRYYARCVARPAYEKAMADHLAMYPAA